MEPKFTVNPGAAPLIGAALLFLAGFFPIELSAQLPPPPPEYDDGKTSLHLEPYVKLDPLSVSELGSGDFAENGVIAGDLSSSRGLGSDGILSPLSVIREVPRLWELRRPLSVYPGALEVRYQLFGANGREGMMTHETDASSFLPIRISGIPPVLIDRTGEVVVLQGGAFFHLDLSSARFSGAYRGVLIVTIMEL